MILQKSETFAAGYRNLTKDERELISRIISYHPLRRPVDITLKMGAQVKEIFPDGTLEFALAQNKSAYKQCYYPVEAQFMDNGIPVNALVFYIGNEVSMLEIVKADGSEISWKPSPKEWVILDLS
jgi:hypothetical protein